MECTGGVKTVDEVKDSFAKMAAAAEAGEPTFHFVALSPDGPPIGKCGLSPIDSPVAPDELKGAFQVGWSLRADCWGKGYAREAAQAAMVLAFERFGLTQLYSQTSERNAASWGLMERLGMRRRADLDYPDPEYPPEDNPTMVYAITRDEWQAKQ
jgi:RimJ/RimL family protein N-acetyltransferase